MAKVKFGMMMTDASGKLGGQVFSKNRSGSYVRTKVTPSNPQTVAQMAIRATLGAISSAWSDLTAEQRASFNNAVEDWKKTDIFGDLKKPTGKNLFTSLNINLVASNQSQITTAPEKAEIPYIGLFQYEIDLALSTMVAGGGTAPAGFKAIISATPPLSQGTSYYKGKFRDISIIDAVDLDSYNTYTNYTSRFGVPQQDANIAFRVKLVAPNGQSGVPETVKAWFNPS